MAGEGCEGEGEKGACSECSSRVIPGGIPFGAKWERPYLIVACMFDSAQCREAGWGTLWNAKRSLNVRADRSASHNCP